MNKLFLEKKFKDYYIKNKIDLPRYFEKREFAFVPITSQHFTMQRHLAFKSYQEFKSYVLRNVPAHIYYSSAYYLKPDAEKMDEKGWIAADLIFDIDADHLPVKLDFERSLKLAKKELKKLLIVLRKDFGIKDDEVEVYFSGSRGYHVHVYSEDFIKLNSQERKEIVDYIVLNSPDIKFDSNVSERVLKYMKKYSKSFEEALEKLRIHIDSPVTADVKRLIRLPGSLHGKTGLKVVKVEDVDNFDPLTDSVVFGEERISVRLLSNVNLRLKDFKLKAKAGEVVSVPEFMAIFLICREVAKF
ncbi:MAG: DNA primase catalytic subunit PriS [Archaeoglobaceae archaeon]|nr:DNA primase catalytic subunit PriS [Archaeoglobaceae archaeon]MCX8151682.1 DNA primase catalytic subunit PriS [Archaeoglobaceae archaeon]MDW8013040.1 DNA primase catalytic subunit PriS [Archaeoglobaceae archaeon]